MFVLQIWSMLLFEDTFLDIVNVNNCIITNAIKILNISFPIIYNFKTRMKL